MIFFPFVVIIRLVLHFLELLYKSCLQIKSRSIFSLVHYFWSLASRIFLVLVMVTYLLLYYRVSILLNLSPTQTLAVGHSVPFLLSSHCPHSDSICSTPVDFLQFQQLARALMLTLSIPQIFPCCSLLCVFSLACY